MFTPNDRVGIHQVLADYGHVDDHDWDNAGQVFTADVEFDPGSGRHVLHGIAEIIATFKGRNAYAHHTTNVTLAEGGDGNVYAQSKLLCFPNDGPRSPATTTTPWSTLLPGGASRTAARRCASANSSTDPASACSPTAAP